MASPGGGAQLGFPSAANRAKNQPLLSTELMGSAIQSHPFLTPTGSAVLVVGFSQKMGNSWLRHRNFVSYLSNRTILIEVQLRYSSEDLTGQTWR